MLIEIIYFYNPGILKIDNFLITINIFQLCMERTIPTLTLFSASSYIISSLSITKYIYSFISLSSLKFLSRSKIVTPQSTLRGLTATT